MILKKTFLLILIGMFCSVSTGSAAEEKIFGPAKYTVKERYGRKNQYTESVKAPAGGGYVVKLQNGEKPAERSDLLAFSLNGTVLIKEGTYSYDYLACFVTLKSENTMTLAIRDFSPTGLKRPPATPRNATIEVVPAPVKMPDLVLGLNRWEDLVKYANIILKIKSSESLSLVLTAANLQNENASRADALRRLADRKDPVAQDFILHQFSDPTEVPSVRAEAAIALGILNDKTVIPALIQGALDPEELIRISSARALSFYNEEYTNAPFSQALKRLDSYMRTAVIQTLLASGWKPVSVLIEFAESTDPAIANMGVELMAGSQDQRIIDLLLRYIDKPGVHDVNLIIRGLGESKDPRTADAVLRLARDREKRKGREAALGMALAKLGDPKSADLIVAMMKEAETPQTYRALRDAYKELTGQDYKK